MLIQQKISKKLTKPDMSCSGDPAFTHQGQAHFAIPGCGAHCGGCAYYEKLGAKGNNFFCAKARQMGNKSKRHLPKSANACKYFEAADGSSG